MRAKETEAISGMHMPSGENMWASPADDKEEEDEDMNKQALGLTSIPGEQQNDYQLEQPFHIKDLDNVGVVDVDSVVSVSPMNNAEDSCPEKKMEELLKDLIDELESRGYAEKANLLKVAYPGQTGQVPGYGKSTPAFKPISLKTPEEPNLGTSDPNLDEYGEGYQSFSSIEDMIQSGIISNRQAEVLREYSKRQSILPEAIRRELGIDIEYAKQLSSLLTEESKRNMSAPKQMAKTRTRSDWDNYSSAGPQNQALAKAWQQNTPEGYSSDFDSFKVWYTRKSQELGRHFGPEEAVKMLPTKQELPTSEKPAEAATVGLTEEQTEKTPEVEPQQNTEESVRGVIEQFLSELLSGSTRIKGFLGTRNRAARQRIRNLGGVDAATDSILDMAGGWENLAKYDTHRDQENKVFSDLEQAAWGLLREARRAQRKSRAEDDLLRTEARNKRLEFLEKISS